MKKLIIALILFVATPAFADYTITLKNDSDEVLKVYTVTTNQVTHMQKVATRTGISVIKQFESTVLNLINGSEATNVALWRRENAAFMEEQARQ